MLENTAILAPFIEDEDMAHVPVRRARPTEAQAHAAIRTLLAWAGDDPARAGLRDTPARVARAYREWFCGYAQDPVEILARTFDEVAGYHEPVILRDIPIESHCEHHMAAIRGVAHIAYIPNGRVVGISKLARLADAYAKRLQIQERLTAEIGTALQQVLKPKGVAVAINATHDCMTTRGVRKHGGSLVTYHFSGAYEEPEMRERFLRLIG
jgi:GTP cyclohydrolase I